ncbi:hypothetical protein Cus16_0009 [Curtobacterium sp. ER1/6]|nr:hypothetical protein Cus16_0009 [Curtobacterium sp. ER1/6]
MAGPQRTSRRIDRRWRCGRRWERPGNGVPPFRTAAEVTASPPEPLVPPSPTQRRAPRDPASAA